jgi:alkanesulfonate monooxygenase SsuD/methylene tetrahydromethanopterin reductase-like flavin-dependent oxidoreductase (luciferase family)
MRFGVLVPVGSAEDAGDLIVAARTVEDHGLDVVLLEGGAAGPAEALTGAAFLAGATAAVRVVAVAPVGPHPVHIAEQAAVADNALQGRLILALHDDATGGGDLLAETAAVVLAAVGTRPFRHRGTRWTIPGNLDGNTSERRVNVTPKPAQLELPVWVAGRRAPAVAGALGLNYLSASADGESARAWSLIEESLGGAVAPMRRPGIRPLNCDEHGAFDDAALVQELTAAADLWSLDLAIFRLPRALVAPARRRALTRLASLVRPYLQIDAVPSHVHEYWRRELPARVGLEGPDHRGP